MITLAAVLAAALAAAIYQVAVASGRARELQIRLEARDTEAVALRADLAAERANHDTLRQTFAALSKEALDSNSAHFARMADQIVKPVHDSLDKVQARIRELEQARVSAYASLSQQVRGLMEQQRDLRNETGNLVKALRAPAVRGRWGEMQLKRVAEMSGMLEHCDFEQQTTFTGDEGRLRPDLTVRLPGGKTLVVDAKAPLSAYLDALEAHDEATRAAHLANHARQLKNHVAQLARKAYWDQLAHTPEFVVLFVPNEAVFAAAMEADSTLMEGAFSERVLLASPTTLIALLRAAAFGWTQERLARDAQEIASLGRDLHKRLGKLAEHFAKAGRGLATAVGAYNDAIGSFEHMVVPAARKLRDKAAPMDEELMPMADVDVTPRPLAPADPAALLPDDAN